MPVTALNVICFRREVEILTSLMQITVRQSLTSFVECEVGFKHFVEKKYNSPRYPHRKYVFHSNGSSHTEELSQKSLLFVSLSSAFLSFSLSLCQQSLCRRKKLGETQQLSIIILIFVADKPVHAFSLGRAGWVGVSLSLWNCASRYCTNGFA